MNHATASGVTSWLSDFTGPGARYRGKPFWGLDGALEPDELRRQIRVMHDMGLGGCFMHARTGLATPYAQPRAQAREFSGRLALDRGHDGRLHCATGWRCCRRPAAAFL